MSTTPTPFHREQALARFAAMALAHKKRVGQQIRQLREAHGWTQRELANRIAAETVDAGYVSKWERGIYYPDEHLEALAEALGTSPGGIMAGVHEEVDEAARPSAPDPFANPQLERIERKLDRLLQAEGIIDQVHEDLEADVVASAREPLPEPETGPQEPDEATKRREAS